MKKIFIIGPLIGAVAALFIKMKGKKAEPAAEAPAAPAEDTSPPA